VKKQKSTIAVTNTPPSTPNAYPAMTETGTWIATEKPISGNATREIKMKSHPGAFKY
tara:strand:- start:124 stop:294 length:171 start_codon:yes stop_codon:yes gene_type:complete